MEYVLCLLGGIVIGLIIAVIFAKVRTIHGILRIDYSDPEKDRYRFDIDNLDILPKKKRIVLKVDANADLSQN
jgi:hypothetical protein